MIKHRLFAFAVAAAAATVTVAPPAEAGVDWFGIGFRVGDVDVSLGYHDYPEYSDAWSDPYWQMDYDRMLDGYGQWVHVAGLGRVWQPYVRADWRPYSHGRWVWSSYGWTWLSYEPWGYVPHHYGEWALSPYGWVWVPGYSYNPGNVVWCRTSSYVGWYPRAPHGWSHANRGFRRGYDRGYSHGHRDGYDRGYGDGYWDGWEDARHATWTEWGYLDSSDVSRHAVDPGYVSRQIGRSSVMPLEQGPSRADVQRYTGRPVRQAAVAEREVRVGDRTVRAVRLESMDSDVRSHARATVQRGLAPEVTRKLERGERVTREAHQVRAARGAESRAVTGRDRVQARPEVGRRPEQAARPRVESRSGSAAQPARPGAGDGRGRSIERSAPPSTSARPDVRRNAPAPSARPDVRRNAPAPSARPDVRRSAPAPSASRPDVRRNAPAPSARPDVRRSAPAPSASRPDVRRNAPAPSARPDVRRNAPAPSASRPEVDRSRRAPSDQGRGPVIVPPTRSATPQASSRERGRAPAPRAVPQQSAPQRSRATVRQAPGGSTRAPSVAPRATSPQRPQAQARPARPERATDKPERGKPRRR